MIDSCLASNRGLSIHTGRDYIWSTGKENGQETANTKSEAVKPGQEEIKPNKQQMKNYLKAKIKSLSWK